MSSCEHISNKTKVNLFLVALTLFVIILCIGTIGYKYLFGLTWTNSIYSASLILTSISVESTPKTTAQKAFISIYSLISVIVFLSIASYAINGIASIIENKL